MGIVSCCRSMDWVYRKPTTLHFNGSHEQVYLGNIYLLFFIIFFFFLLRISFRSIEVLTLLKLYKHGNWELYCKLKNSLESQVG